MRVDIARIDISSTLTAFKRTGVVGSKVIDPAKFGEFLVRGIEQYDWSRCRTPGQGFIVLPPEAFGTVSCGDAPVGGLTKDDLHPVFYRGEWGLFAKRNKAAPVVFLGVGVYTREAYNSDPQVVAEWRTVPPEIDFVIAYIIAAADNKGPAYSSARLARNLAGGNNDFVLTGNDAKDAEIARFAVVEAKKAVERETQWITVAD